MNPGSGTAYFDAIQLEKGNVVSKYNFVQNSSLERDTDSDGMPDNWTGNSLSTSDGLNTTNVFVGNQSFEINGEANTKKSIKQHLDISGDSSTGFTLSGWSKQEGADQNGGYYNIQMAINNSDGTIDYTNAIDFNKSKTDWQHVAAEVKPSQPFDSIDVYYYYYDQTGTAWFDAMRLETGASHTFYSYDANNNYLTKTTDPSGDAVSYTYDSVGNKTSMTDGNGNKTSYGYNANNWLTKVTDAKLNATTYGYDGKVTGQASQTRTGLQPIIPIMSSTSFQDSRIR
jgi:YD repeat-containing protein